jgi:ABC-type multidrug transport system fused ATPase/permease subunit
VTTAFLVAGTDVSSFPVEHCASLRHAGVAVAFLPAARALGFARASRGDRVAIPSLDTLSYFVSARPTRRALLVVDPTGSLDYAPLEGAAAGESTPDWVLRGVSLRIEPGETVALVGPSGAGQTTLAALIPRVWDVQERSIPVDGIDVRQMRLVRRRQVRRGQ